MGGPRKVLVAIQPLMFADVLGRLLEAADVEVVIAPEPTLEQLAEPKLTVAIVPDFLERLPKAALVVIVHDRPDDDLLAEAQFAQGLRVAVRKLPHLLKLVSVALNPEPSGDVITPSPHHA
jgi:hypothetical protein